MGRTHLGISFQHRKLGGNAAGRHILSVIGLRGLFSSSNRLYAKRSTAHFLAVIGAVACVGKSEKNVLAQTCLPTPSNGVSWWRGQDDALDTSGSHHGSLVGNATYAVGKVGRAFSFDGSGDYVSIPNSTDWDLQNDFTIDMWVRFNAVKDTMFIHREQGGFELDYQAGSGRLIFALNPPTAAVSSPWSPIIDRWYFLAVTRTGNSYQLYVDGTPLGLPATAAAPTVVSGGLRVGGYPAVPGFDLNGRIDEVEIVGRALSTAEIAQIFQAGSAGRCPPIPPGPVDLNQGLVGHWTFDDQTANDSSGNSNNGTVFGSAAYTPGISGLALQLDGVDDYVSIADSPTLNPSNAMTVAAWYRPVSFSGGGNDPIVDKGYTSHSPPYYQFHLAASGDQYPSPGRASLGFSVAAGGQNLPGASTIGGGFWKPGEWYHLVGTYDGARVKLFVDGQLVASNPVTGTIPSYGRPVTLGKYSNLNAYLPGTIDDVRIYDRALTPGEVAALWLRSDEGNTALRFDGVDDFVVVQSSPDTRLANAMTLEAWVNANSLPPSGRGGIAGTWNDIGVPQKTYALQLIDSKVLFAVSSNGSSQIGLVMSPVALDVGGWHHLAGTYDGASVRLYMDGVPVATPTSFVGGIAPFSAPLYIGRTNTGGSTPDYFNGTVDEVRLWNIARTQSEIVSSMSCRLRGDESGLVGYWPLDEAYGNTAFDRSGRGNDGALGDSAAARPTWDAATTRPQDSDCCDNLAMMVPVSYSMQNGQSGGYHYWDDAYAGTTGSPTVDGGLLAGGLGQLVDGVVGADDWQANFGNGSAYEWVGWESIEPIITFDFSRSIVLSKIGVHVNNNQAGGVFLFTSITVSFSDDGVNFRDPVLFTTTTADRANTSARFIDVPVTGSGRFVRAAFTDGNPGAWVFISEIQFFSCGPAPSAEICDNGVDDDGDGLVDCNDLDCPSSLGSTIGDSDGFGGSQGAISNPGNHFDYDALLLSLVPGTYHNAEGLDAKTAPPYGPYVFEFEFPIDRLCVQNITTATITVQSGSVGTRTNGTGFGFANVTAQSSTGKIVNLGQFLPGSTGEAGSPAEESVKAHVFDVMGLLESGGVRYILLRIDGSPLPGPDDLFALDFAKLEVGGGHVPVELCDNGIDDDGDALIDCADSDCQAADACTPHLDLVVTELHAPVNAVVQETIEVMWRVENLGDATANGTWIDRLFLSADDKIGGDTQIADAFFPGPLSEGDGYDRAASFDLPTSGGRYWVVVCTDATNQVGESNETNNCRIEGPIVVEGLAADLVASITPLPTSCVESGTTLHVEYTVTNTGNVATSPAQWADLAFMYAGPEITWTGINDNDQIYCNVDPPGIGIPNQRYLLPGGDAYAGSFSIDIPHNIAGPYYVYVLADRATGCHPGWRLSESNKENNLAKVQFCIDLEPQADVTALPTNIQFPANIQANQLFNVTWRDQNLPTAQGPTDTGTWQDTVCLTQSIEGPCDPANDVILGAAGPDGDVLQPDQETELINLEKRLPVDLEGAFYVKVMVDTSNSISEIGMPDNNTVVARVSNGDPKQVTVTIGIQVDLEAESLAIQGGLVPGQVFTANWLVRNVAADPEIDYFWKDALYLSDDDQFDRDTDRIFGIFGRSSMPAAGQAYSDSQSLRLWTDVRAGPQYLLLVVDVDDEVFEPTNKLDPTQDYNNILALPINVEFRATDVAPSINFDAGHRLPPVAAVGQAVQLSWKVCNTGVYASNVSTWKDRVYLSTDCVLGADDTSLTTVTRSGTLDAGACYIVEGTAPALPIVPPGNYNLIILADADNNVYEQPPGESNNSVCAPITITDLAADLVVEAVAASSANGPDTGRSGELLHVTWTVCNRGTFATTAASWSDAIALRPSTGGNDQRIGTAAHSGALDVGNCYTAAGDFLVPITTFGTYNLIVTTDVGNGVFELRNDNNTNVPGHSLEIGIKPWAADLTITGQVQNHALTAGELLNLSWIVRNDGLARTNVNAWVDRAYLSVDDVLDTTTDYLLDSRTRGGFLDPGGADYLVPMHGVAVPISFSGEYYVLIKADAGNQVFEINENNNVFQKPMLVNVAANLAADLVVESIVPRPGATFISGQYVQLSWTVLNDPAIGLGSTNVSSWRDAVYLSRDNILDRPGDTFLGYKNHEGILDLGAAYAVTNEPFSIRLGLSGDYHLCVAPDSGNQVYEAGRDDDPVCSVATVNIVAPDPADLVVESVTPPQSPEPVLLGSRQTFGWRITNVGDVPLHGSWQDSLYLSSDQNWDINDVFVGRFTTTPPGGVLQAGASVDAVANNVEIPGVTPPGPYYVIVRTDVFNNVPEINESNNVGNSASGFALDALPLCLHFSGDSCTGDTGPLDNGQSKYFALNTPAGETVKISLNHESPTAQTELYVRFGAVPTPSQYDYVSITTGPNQDLTIPATEAATYYVLARGASGVVSPNATLFAQSLPFQVSAMIPTVLGQGRVTVRIVGSRMPSDVVFLLRNIAQSHDIEPIAVHNREGLIRWLTFDLSNAPKGTYGLVAVRPDDQTQSILPVPIEITHPTPLSINTDLVVPNSVRKGTSGIATIHLMNTSNIDVSVAELQAWTPNVDLGFTISMPSIGASAMTAGDDRTGIALWIPELPPLFDITFTLRIDIDGVFQPSELELFATCDPYSEVAFRDGPFHNLIDAVRTFIIDNASTINDPPLLLFAEDQDTWWELFNAFYDEVGLGGLSGEAARRLSIAADPPFTPPSKPVVACAVACLAPSIVGCFGGPLGCVIGGGTTLGCELYLCGPVVEYCAENPAACKDDKKKRIKTPNAADPNEKSAPIGFGSEQWVEGGGALRYQVFFENVASATASAANVRIHDTLESSLDLGSFRVDQIQFGETTIDVPANRASFSTSVDLRATHGVRVDVTAGANTATREVFWLLSAVDPETGEFPANPDDGILPPNDDTGRGEGSVVFTINPRSDVPTGTVIRNRANIFFDFNEPIVTNEVFNTVDADAPNSQIDTLPANSVESLLPLSWSGDDIVPGSDPPFEGSGLRSVTVFSRLDGGAYVPVIPESLDLSGEFQARGGGTYDFYSVAVDNVGNIEATPATPDGTTTLAVQIPFMPELGLATATVVPLITLGTANLDRINHAFLDLGTGLFIQQDGTLGVADFSQPLDQWSNVLVRGLTPCSEYHFATLAQIDGENTTPPSPPAIIFTSVQGDVDGDDFVTEDDLDIVQGQLGGCYGQPDFDARADLNGDDCVTFADRGLVLSHIGRGDYNFDGFVWYDDLADFVNPACMLGPGRAVSSACRQGDFDLDGDIDLEDSAALQRMFLSDADPCGP